MLTIFTIPKPFAGHIGLIQRNAIASWRRLDPQVEVILFGSDAGVAEAAVEFGTRHEPLLAANSYGTPLISDAFAQARAKASQPVLMYTNADMLYDASLLEALKCLDQSGSFLMSGQRWDMHIQEDLVSAPTERTRTLFASRTTSGRLSGPAAMDYFVLPRTLDTGMPDMAVGRVGWDSWMVWRCRQLGVPVIDATADVAALHQNHSYSSLALGCQHQGGPERDLNIKQAGGLSHLLTLREASHHLVGGRLRSPGGRLQLSAALADNPAYLRLLALNRWLRVKLKS